MFVKPYVSNYEAFVFERREGPVATVAIREKAS